MVICHGTIVLVRSIDRPKRFVAMTLGLGLIAENLFPSTSGFDYQPSPPT